MPEFQEAVISAKRYCLFIKDTRDRIVIRKPSGHVLGTYLSPEDPVDEDQPEDDEDEPEKDLRIARPTACLRGLGRPRWISGLSNT